MSRPEQDPAASNEPHLRPDADPRQRDEQQAGHSVYDEPDIFPGRADETIAQDWSCSKCGYNLRGLPTHHPCPECGHVELYRPAPAGARSYQAWLRERCAAVSPRWSWTVTVLIALCGGPWAVLAAFIGADAGVGWGVGRVAIVTVVIFGPAMEETMKIAAAAIIVEARPYLFRRVEQLQIATIASAALFAAIENVLYLYVYVPKHSDMFALWRWTVCVALHVVCTIVATRGLADVWRRAITEGRRPRLSIGLRSLTIAIIIHACYNAAVLAFETGW